MFRVTNFVSIPEGFITIKSTFPEFENVRRKVNLDLDSLEGGRIPFPFRIEIEEIKELEKEKQNRDKKKLEEAI